jgi:hypothetical protein
MEFFFLLILIAIWYYLGNKDKREYDKQITKLRVTRPRTLMSYEELAGKRYCVETARQMIKLGLVDEVPLTPTDRILKKYYRNGGFDSTGHFGIQIRLLGYGLDPAGPGFVGYTPQDKTLTNQ